MDQWVDGWMDGWMRMKAGASLVRPVRTPPEFLPGPTGSWTTARFVGGVDPPGAADLAESSMSILTYHVIKGATV